MEQNWLGEEKRGNGFYLDGKKKAVSGTQELENLMGEEIPKEKIVAHRHFVRYFIGIYCTIFFSLSLFHLGKADLGYGQYASAAGIAVGLLGLFLLDRICGPYDIKVQLPKRLEKEMKRTVTGISLIFGIVQLFFLDLQNGILYYAVFSLFVTLTIIASMNIQEDLLKDHYEFKSIPKKGKRP